MKSKQIILSLSLLLVGVGQLSAMQDQIPIPIYTSEEEYIIIRTPDLIQINCVYDTDNNTLIFGIVGSTETLAVSINNLSSYESYCFHRQRPVLCPYKREYRPLAHYNHSFKRARVCQRDNPLRRIITIWSSELRRDG